MEVLLNNSSNITGVEGESPKVILDLCGGTGAWSKPYRDAGYDVRLVTLPANDIMSYIPPDKVHGVLAAPPCTDFAISGARWWKSKGDIPLIRSLRLVNRCLDIIDQVKPVFWVLENPVGRLCHYIGKARFIFHPWEFGDPYTKRTCLWGNFKLPVKTPCTPKDTSRITHSRPGRHIHPSIMWLIPPRPDRALLRSITPQGFAKAFYEANR